MCGSDRCSFSDSLKPSNRFVVSMELHELTTITQSGVLDLTSARRTETSYAHGGCCRVTANELCELGTDHVLVRFTEGRGHSTNQRSSQT